MTATYFEWVIPGRFLEERWDEREFKEYPPDDAPKETIDRFIADAKKAQDRIAKELMMDGLSKKDAVNAACQWPLKDDAPEEAVRNFIAYNRELQEAAKNGIDL